MRAINTIILLLSLYVLSFGFTLIDKVKSFDTEGLYFVYEPSIVNVKHPPRYFSFFFVYRTKDVKECKTNYAIEIYKVAKHISWTRLQEKSYEFKSYSVSIYDKSGSCMVQINIPWREISHVISPKAEDFETFFVVIKRQSRLPLFRSYEIIGYKLVHAINTEDTAKFTAFVNTYVPSYQSYLAFYFTLNGYLEHIERKKVGLATAFISMLAPTFSFIDEGIGLPLLGTTFGLGVDTWEVLNSPDSKEVLVIKEMSAKEVSSLKDNIYRENKSIPVFKLQVSDLSSGKKHDIVVKGILLAGGIVLKVPYLDILVSIYELNKNMEGLAKKFVDGLYASAFCDYYQEYFRDLLSHTEDILRKSYNSLFSQDVCKLYKARSLEPLERNHILFSGNNIRQKPLYSLSKIPALIFSVNYKEPGRCLFMPDEAFRLGPHCPGFMDIYRDLAGIDTNIIFKVWKDVKALKGAITDAIHYTFGPLLVLSEVISRRDILGEIVSMLELHSPVCTDIRGTPICSSVVEKPIEKIFASTKTAIRNSLNKSCGASLEPTPLVFKKVDDVSVSLSNGFVFVLENQKSTYIRFGEVDLKGKLLWIRGFDVKDIISEQVDGYPHSLITPYTYDGKGYIVAGSVWLDTGPITKAIFVLKLDRRGRVVKTYTEELMPKGTGVDKVDVGRDGRIVIQYSWMDTQGAYSDGGRGVLILDKNLNKIADRTLTYVSCRYDFSLEREVCEEDYQYCTNSIDHIEIYEDVVIANENHFQLKSLQACLRELLRDFYGFSLNKRDLLIVSERSNAIVARKISYSGNMEWNILLNPSWKAPPGRSTRLYDLQVSRVRDGFIFVYEKAENRIQIVKVSNDGKILWSKEVFTNNEVHDIKVMSLSENLLAVAVRSLKETRVIYVDTNGNIYRKNPKIVRVK